MISLEHVSKTFSSTAGNVHAVKDVTLHIKDGEIFGIIGFSGAGKSTLVRCINLLERPTEGKVLVADDDLMSLSAKELREVRKKIGMIFQYFNLMKSRTVYQNIAFPLKDSKLSKEEKDKKILSLLELVDLKEKKDAYPSQLSGGQKQRVAIARALANSPKVLLCDEATSALDPQTTKSILKLLKRVNEELGITIVLITHEMAVIKEICDRVAVMENGHVVEEGNIVDIFTNPHAEVTRNFIASTSNLSQIYEMVEQGSDLTRLQSGEVLVRLHYGGTGTGKPLISEISRKFNVNTNIIFGNVEVLHHIPLGDLIMILGGEQVDEALHYMKEHDVDVEVINKC
ncbi:methionine ABC transporter ATP-binding protein [Amedibacterium intestinale]|uniref:methionine ABC transporter ATP-binding protein n=1 Tax=Amedibacterium intestinale TaxID=2583452 RepID=UPI000E49342B|nr:methionine ABC transporter ATP-binding protein [Amedibacterium intestinale]RHO22314.1 methionine ABC transporter ATP-binding protein [Eubacterium sp. AM18-26]RHO26995.1 methionine ABC transporter ATP-binding protein [Eubacterium sp. AM18-10LB-B]